MAETQKPQISSPDIINTQKVSLSGEALLSSRKDIASKVQWTSLEWRITTEYRETQMNATNTFLSENCQNFEKYTDFQTIFDSDNTFQQAFCWVVSDAIICGNSKIKEVKKSLRWNGMPVNIEEINMLKTEMWQKEEATVKDKEATVKDKEVKVEEKKTTVEELIVNLEKSRFPEITNKYIPLFKEFKDKPQSEWFQTAMKGLLSELKSQAKTPESLAEYTSFVEQFHSIGAVSEVDYAVLKREMEELSKGLSSKSAEGGGKSSDYKLPEGFHESQDTRGVYTKYASVGESFDQVVTIKDGKGSKDIISPRSGYSVHLADAVNLEEQNFLNQEASLRAKLGNVTQTFTEILAKNDDFIAKEEKREGKTPKDMETLEKAKEFKKEKTEEFEKQKKEFEAKLAKLEHEKAQKMPVSGDIESREKQARDTIQFVDDMGLYMLGVENVDTFFKFANSQMTNGNKINSEDGLDGVEKDALKKVFIEFLWGTNSLFSGYSLSEGKTTEDIKKLLVAKEIYEVGKVPPVKRMNEEELKIAMNKGKPDTKNTLG